MRGPLGVASAAAAVTAYVGVIDPNQAGHYPTCPFLALTGLYCPGCGSLRAVHALTHGDLTTALGLNVLTVLAALALGVIWVRFARRQWQGVLRTTAAPAWSLLAVAVVVVAFGVVRNLPVGAGLAP